jgi:protein O-GlcNAc transferase
MADNQRIEDLRRRVQEDPASIAFAQLVEELRRAGRLEEAVTECRSGLAERPSFTSVRVTLGRALLDLGRLDDAESELRTVLDGAPDHVAAVRALGDVFERRGLAQDALAQFRKALELRYDPDLQQMIDALAATVPESSAIAAPAAEPPPGRRRAVRQLAALEQWLDAIHVARTERNA